METGYIFDINVVDDEMIIDFEYEVSEGEEVNE